MEQHGYDVSYISNIDTHADPAGLLRTKGFISVGHDEYWTLDMYDNVMKARDEGVSLAFFGGNSVLCVVPMLPSGKRAAQPGRRGAKAGSCPSRRKFRKPPGERCSTRRTSS